MQIQRHEAALARAVLKSATDFAIVTTDLRGRITSWNPGAEHLLGWSAEEMMGEEACRFFTPEDVAGGRIHLEMKLARQYGRAEDERWHLRRDGSRLWASGLMMRFEDEETQEHVGYLKILRDRTPQHAAEEQLHVRHAQQQALVRLSDRLRDGVDPAAISRIAGEIVGTTLGADLVGYGVVDPVAETITVEADWTTPGAVSLEGIARFRDYGVYIDDLKAGRTVVVENAFTDPRTRDFADALAIRSATAFINAPLQERGAFVALLYVSQARPRTWTQDELAFVREVAARVRTSAERARSDRALRDLAASLEAQVRERTADRNRLWSLSADLMLVATFEGVINAVNPAWEAVLGWREDELIGSSLFDLIHPEDLPHTLEGASEIGAGRSYTLFENRYRHRDGSYRCLAWTTGPGDGAIVGIARDVTGEKEQARALSVAEDQLRQSQKMEAVGQLTGGVAHDFNNLLTILRSSLDFLRRPDLPEARRSRYLDAASETVERASKLTGQLLAFARRQSLTPEVFDVGARVRSVGDMLDTVTGARVQVIIDAEPKVCFVRADVSQFETALVNMAVNARDAMENGGRLTLQLRCGLPLPSIRGHAGSEGAFAAVSVRDTGTGIAADKLAQIFEPFFTTKEVGKGTGLGLSQVFGFAKQSGGDVDVESTLGEGSTFTLFLPEQQPAHDLRASGPMRSVNVMAHGSGKRVLIVEDNQEVGRFSAQILEDLGYAIEWVTDAEAALRRLGDDGAGFDIVFSDVVMPGMGGVALAEELRRRLPNLPVVLTSGYSHVLASDLDHGFTLLRKPYSADRLAGILAQASSRSDEDRPRSVGPLQNLPGR